MRHFPRKFVVLVFFLGVVSVFPAKGQEDCSEQVAARIQVELGHPWRPPFGVDRVGRPFAARVEISYAKPPRRDYSLVGHVNGKEVERQLLHLTYNSFLTAYVDTAVFQTYPTEVALFARCTYRGQPIELARQQVESPSFEADASARPDHWINPVDLGTVLVPHDWLLLARGQRAIVRVAAISYARDLPGVRAEAWFQSAPRDKVTSGITLEKGHRAEVQLTLPPPMAAVKDDLLHIRVTDSAGQELWHKEIKMMLVSDLPHWPRFGATATRLRYDAPISVRDPVTGVFSSMNYEGAWAPDLKDVVVSFPNGARFVFWRGSSYVPFWASKHNTGFSYEWAETKPPPGGFVDSVEPLMDKELRYGRVEILESTPARVHVRWTYQSCDFNYKVWGDSAAEDFYFYPDGYGTRVLTLQSAMNSDYELSEFIILTPQAAYPLEVLPKKVVELLFVDGLKLDVSFPFQVEGMTKPFTWPDYIVQKARGTPIVYRIRINKDDRETAIYFDPLDTHVTKPFSPFYDRGYQVTPAYWGSHWPLSRGKSTGYSIDDRIDLGPGHNSVMTWGLDNRPTPLSSSAIETLDTLGQSKPMTIERWAWLIGMTDDSDQRLLERARSFSIPPSLELKGAKLAFRSYVPERRAIRLIVEDKTVTITFKPPITCVDPVFELRGQQGNLVAVSLAGRTLRSDEYAWDGHLLWLNAEIGRKEDLQLEFSGASP